MGSADEQFVIDTRKVDPTPLKALLEDPKHRKVLHNAKFDYAMLAHHYDIRMENMVDTMLLEMVLQNGKLSKGFGLAACVERYTKEVVSKEMQQSFIEHEGDFSTEQLEYAARDVVYPINLALVQTGKLKAQQLTHTAKLECAAVAAVADMELNGILLDRTGWDALQVEAAEEAAVLGKELTSDHFASYLNRHSDGGFVDIPEDMNLDSDKQVLAALKYIGIPVETTSKAQLMALRSKHPALDVLFNYREKRKIVTTYGAKFLAHVHDYDGRIHCDFRQMGAESGRMSCTKPNLQNIPNGDDFRECFIAEEGNVMITADYSGCELRILAHYSRDPVFVAAFKAGEDLHSRVATMMFGKEVSKTENKDLRDRAKTINFGLVYGMSHYKLADRLQISEDEAKKLYDHYFELFPGVRKWLDSAGRAATSRGYARTIGGRKRYFNLDGIDKDQRQRGAVERKGKNTPIQGTNADITKLALYKLRSTINAQGLPAKLVNTVHDEIVVECAEDAAESVRTLVVDQMVSAGEFYVTEVPMEVDASVGKCWSK